ncbi:hypothetical protein GCM10010488_18760 [Oerskovia jenensis]
MRPEDIRSCFPLLLVWLSPGAISGWAEVLGVGYGVGQGVALDPTVSFPPAAYDVTPLAPGGTLSVVDSPRDRGSWSSGTPGATP